MTITAWLMAGCGIGTASSDPEAADELVGRSFVSTSVVKEGEPQSLVEGPLEVSFRYPPENADRDSDDEVLVGWTSGCNHYGLRINVSDDRFLKQEGGGHDMTQAGCEPAMTEQERWLTEFFRGSPRWELEGSDLTVANNNIEIDFEEVARNHG